MRSSTARTVVTSFLCTLALSSIRPAQAHPLDEANLYHFFTCKLNANSLSIDYRVMVGGLVVFKAWNEADTDRNHSISSSEQSIFNKKIADRLNLTLGGKPLPLRVTSSQLPEYDDFIAGTVPYFQFQLTADLPHELKGPREIRLVNDNFPAYSNLYPDADIASASGCTAKIVTDKNAKGFHISAEFSAGSQPIDANILSGQTPPSKPTNRLMGYVKPGGLSGGSFVVAMLVALVLGAGHALTPGHGKTLVGAYLVGERGTVKDAVFLGLIVTFTHVSTVYLFGFVVLGAVHFLTEKQLGIWMGALSGALVIGTGFWLLVRGILRWYGIDVDHHSHSHEHHENEHHHHDEHDHDHSHETDDHHHDHSHDHNTAHHHHHHHHLPGPGKGSLLSLGLAGGAVPCPDAIAVLAASIAAGNTLLGLCLITSFSIGLAAVLIGIGILMVTAKSMMARFTGEGKFLRALPIISSAVVIGLGISLFLQTLVQGGIITLNRP